MNEILGQDKDPCINDPIIMLARAIEKQRRDTLDQLSIHGKQIHDIEQEQLKLTGQVACVNKALSNGEFLFCIPFLGHLGVEVPTCFHGSVGGEIKDIAEEIGYYPDKKDKKPFMGFMTHRYPPDVLMRAARLWITRNRYKRHREGWFYNGT
jgi:hypothetical protein